jgi:cytoskeletal protein CcmA (bactofilin family)
MQQLSWTLLLFAVTLGVFSVPLWPAFWELRRKGAHMLAIDRQNDGSAVYAALLALRNSGQTQTLQDIHIQSHTHVDAVDCVGDVHVGKSASANAARATYIFLDESSTVRNVACASDMLCVQPDCLFRWLEAPTITFTSLEQDAAHAKTIYKTPPIQPNTINPNKQKKFTRIDGSWEPEPQSQINGDYVVTMDVKLAPGCLVAGSIKAYGSVVMGERSSVLGSVFAAGKVELLPAAQVLGVISAGQEVHLHAGSVVGHLDQLSSVNAPIIVAQAGARVHGSLKARTQGRSRA